MSDVLKQVAAVHRERFAKAEKARLLRKKKLGTQQAYFKDSGIKEMWDDVKELVIANPCPDMFEGFTIPLSALLVETATENIEQTGLVLNDKHGAVVQWAVEDHSNDDEDHAKIHYRGSMPKNNFCLAAEHADAKKKFTDSFVKWLSRHITPRMLAEMDIDLETPSIVKRSRKILQLAET